MVGRSAPDTLSGPKVIASAASRTERRRARRREPPRSASRSTAAVASHVAWITRRYGGRMRVRRSGSGALLDTSARAPMGRGPRRREATPRRRDNRVDDTRHRNLELILLVSKAAMCRCSMHMTSRSLPTTSTDRLGTLAVSDARKGSRMSCEQSAAIELIGSCVPSWRRRGRSRASLSVPFAQSTWRPTPAQVPASWRSSWPTTSSPKPSSQTSTSAGWRNSRRPRRCLGGRRSVARRVRVLRDHLLDLGRRPWPPSVHASCATQRRVGPAQSSSCPSEFRSSRDQYDRPSVATREGHTCGAERHVSGQVVVAVPGREVS